MRLAKLSCALFLLDLSSVVCGYRRKLYRQKEVQENAIAVFPIYGRLPNLDIAVFCTLSGDAMAADRAGGQFLRRFNILGPTPQKGNSASSVPGRGRSFGCYWLR